MIHTGSDIRGAHGVRHVGAKEKGFEFGDLKHVETNQSVDLDNSKGLREGAPVDDQNTRVESSDAIAFHLAMKTGLESSGRVESTSNGGNCLPN